MSGSVQGEAYPSCRYRDEDEVASAEMYPALAMVCWRCKTCAEHSSEAGACPECNRTT